MKTASGPPDDTQQVYDLFIIGGGINGCGIARDAAGRGLSVALAEKNDLASATSSASTKLFHGGLRYLEYFEIRLVREALIEREILLRAMPHISRPMRFVLPYHREMRFEGETPVSQILNRVMPWMRGRRPAWLIRMGLFLYDHLGGRKLLPGTTTLDLTTAPEGAPLKDEFQKAFEYSDCWVEDSRLVTLNARDAAQRGAQIWVGAEVQSARRSKGHWEISLKDLKSGAVTTVLSKVLVNAGGPWVGDILQNKIQIDTNDGVRLVRGSHIVTKKLFSHDKCYFFQGRDGRIIFAIPYESDFTLIGTTDIEHPDPSTSPECTPKEQEYLCAFASEYFKQQISPKDIVWSYSGVRPLFDDGASSATAATRDYTLKVDDRDGAPVLNVFGGKITTYRRLAESALKKLSPYFETQSQEWTKGVPLPGGDFEIGAVEGLISNLKKTYGFLDDFWACRLIRAYGLDAMEILGSSQAKNELGKDFGATLTEREVDWLIDHEFARHAEDIVWRRSRLGLRLSTDQISELEDWMQERRNHRPQAVAQ